MPKSSNIASLQKKNKKSDRPNIFKKSTQAKNAGIKFWMDDWSYRRLYNSKPEDSLEQILSLYSIKKTISNFVQITSNTPVHVIYKGSQSSVDKYKSITISSDLKDFDSVVGLSLHESSHLSFSILDLYETLYQYVEYSFAKKYIVVNSNTEIDDLLRRYWAILKNDWNQGMQLFMDWKNIINWLEDRRIDYLQSQRFPGYTQYYEKLYSNYFYHSDITTGLRSKLYRTPTFDSYMFRLLNSINEGSDDTALPNLEKMIEKISMTNINNCKNNIDTAVLALKVFEMIYKECKSNIDPKTGKPKTDRKASEENQSSSSSQSQQSEENEDSEKNDSNANSNENESENDESEESETSNSGENEDTEDDEDFKDENFENEEQEYEKIDRETIEELMGKIEDLLNQNDDALKTPLNVDAGEKMKLLETGEMKIEKPSEIKVNAHVISITGITENITKIFPKLFYRDSTLERFVITGINQGVVLGKKLQIMNDTKVISTLRKYSGKIDQRLLPEIGFGNDKIFSHTSKTEFNKLYVHLTLDASGSMRGIEWNMTMQMAAALVTALTFVEGARCVVSTRATYNMINGENPYNMVIYDSRKNRIDWLRKWWHTIYATGNTPEGFVFDALLPKILADANGTDAFFINLSDGSPSCSAVDWSQPRGGIDYEGDDAIEHTRLIVEKMVKNNITVISYFVSDKQQNFHYTFDRMYGKYAHYINVIDMNKLAATLNKRFIQRNRVTKTN